MIQLKHYPPIEGPYRRPIRWGELALSVAVHVALGTLMAYAALGAAGWL